MSPPVREPGGLRARDSTFPALVWSLLHVPLLVGLYATPIAAAVRSAPAPWRVWMWPTFPLQAALIALVAWIVGLPFLVSARVYRFAAPAAAGLVTAAVALDSRIYDALGYHLNGFFLRVMMQPNALREAGVPRADLAIFLGAAAAFLAVDVWAGSRFLRRFAHPRRTWAWALGLLLLAAGERVYGGTLTHFGGPAFFAASTVLPLQVPVRMEGIVRKLAGGAHDDPFARAGSAATRLPAGVAPAEIRFARKPDVLFLVAESLPSEHLDERTMPNLWRRALAGARFPNHYSGASNTEFGIFSLVYGLQAQKLEATLGAGRQPLLFPAFRANGYAMRVLAASCVDWMDLKQTAFGGVQDVLETWCGGHDPQTSDAEMMQSAERFLAKAPPDQPVFLFLFFFGTHFNYFREAQDVVFTPEWDGADALRATTEPGWKIENRARNAARTLDRRIERFLERAQAIRGRDPLVFFTGDHGEEFRQKGHIGHGSQVTREQVNVPAIWFGPGVPRGVFEAPTSHPDVVPTLFSLLGDTHAPSLHSDGMCMFDAPLDRFVVTTVGWEPGYAVVGRDLKVRMYAGSAAVSLTDLDDRPLPDGQERLARDAPRMLRALRGEPEPAERSPTARTGR